MASTQAIFTKMPPPMASSSLVPKDTRRLIRALVLSCLCQVLRGLARAKSYLVKVVQKKLERLQFHFTLPSRNDKNKKIYLGSFRFHYNWASTASSSRLEPHLSKHIYYYDPGWNSKVSMKPGEDHATTWESQLSKYLKWLEEKDNGEESHNDTIDREGCVNEIDKLADMFIAKGHELFILEKEESYRRFQEMIAI